MLGPQGKLQPGPYVVEGLTRTLGCAFVQMLRVKCKSLTRGCRPLTAAGDGIQSQGRDRTHGHRQPEGSSGHGPGPGDNH